MRFVPALAALALAGCASMLPQGPVALSGSWGGPHVGLVLEGGLGSLEYDCASGTIDTAVIPTKAGAFTAVGTHRTGQGGPVRVGQIFIAQRAKYSGTAVKDDMTLTATLEDGTVLGPFTLRKGEPPQITRCL